MTKATITVDEAAKILGIGRATAYEACYAGTIYSIRIGKRILIPLKPFQELLDKPLTTK